MRRGANGRFIPGVQPIGIIVADHRAFHHRLYRHVFDMAGDGSAGHRRRTTRAPARLDWVLQRRLGGDRRIRLFHWRRDAAKLGIAEHVLCSCWHLGSGICFGDVVGKAGSPATRRARGSCVAPAASNERRLPIAHCACDVPKNGVAGKPNGLPGD